MKYLLLFFIVSPVFGLTQTVKPVISQDYLDLIHKNTIKNKAGQPDTLNSIRSSPVSMPNQYFGFTIDKISIKDNQLKLNQAKNPSLVFGGSIKLLAQIKSPNRMPGLQSEYVQGSSENGNLSWKGPETNESFSYGPQHNSLEFDGSNYNYDRYGRLVAKGSGNGLPSTPYNNDIIQNSTFLSRSLVFHSTYKRKYVNVVTSTFSLNKTNESTILPKNKMSSQNASAVVEVLTKPGIITGSFQSQANEQINTNRNGFLSRVYQNILLTPSSFDNQQGSVLPGGQRSYSRYVDNPHFLLEDNSNRFQQHQKIMSLGLERKKTPLKFNIVQSLEFNDQKNIEAYKPGTAFFEMGMLTERRKEERNYNLRVNTSQDFRYDNYHVRSNAVVNYVMAANKTDINYLHGRQYHYQRNSHDISAGFSTVYSGYRNETEIKLENKIYCSNTTNQPDFFLPSLSARIFGNGLFDTKLTATLTATLSHYNSEVPLNQSFAYAGLFGYTTQDAFQYSPVLEAKTVAFLDPIRHSELNLKADLSYGYQWRLIAELFQHKVNGDVFPLLQNNQILLQNLASHKNRGFELELNSFLYKKSWSSSTALSFSSYRSKVFDVKGGYDYAPMAGFSNIHKTIVNGQPLGVVTGKTFLRNENNELVIGDDGFPLVSRDLKIIANPHPDFVMKFWNNSSWKHFYFSMGWEWKKGGEVWNGTSATLDYYGRSANTAKYRNVTGYVFEGVTTSGSRNTKAVSFYDPVLPVTNNRWTRYGFGGVDEEYVQKADYIRINNISISYKFEKRKYLQSILLSAYVSNILLWTPYNGGDPSQLLYDQSNSSGLDFFNLPSLKQFGFSTTLQF